MYDLNLSVPNISAAKYSDDEKFYLLKNYLLQLNETLSFALSTIDETNFTQSFKENVEKSKETAVNYTQLKAESIEKFNILKNKIIQTADEIFKDYTTAIEKSEQEILLTAQGEYVAKSEFGEYKNEAAASIKENADAIELNANNIESANAALENYISENNAELNIRAEAIVSQVENLFTSKAEFGEFSENISSQITQTANNVTEEFKSEYSVLSEDISALGGSVSEMIYSLDAYIRRGELESGVYGVEIGRSDSNIKARFTNEKLSFIQGETEVAYISENNLYILRAEITDYLKIGNSNDGYFIFDVTENGLEVQWLYGN